MTPFINILLEGWGCNLAKLLSVFQLASLASSYVTKHIHLHTDARINAELTDQIFTAMLVGYLICYCSILTLNAVSLPEKKPVALPLSC